jgi:hypothetical protein
LLQDGQAARQQSRASGLIRFCHDFDPLRPQVNLRATEFSNTIARLGYFRSLTRWAGAFSIGLHLC